MRKKGVFTSLFYVCAYGVSLCVYMCVRAHTPTSVHVEARIGLGSPPQSFFTLCFEAGSLTDHVLVLFQIALYSSCVLIATLPAY